MVNEKYIAELKSFAEKIKGFKSVYTAGGIQNAKLPNSWRNILDIFLKHNGVPLVFNPVLDNADIFNQSIMGYKADGTPVKIDELQDVDEGKEALLYRQTEMNDKKAIKESDLIIFYLDDRIGHGTMKEFDWAYDWGKSIIIIRTISRKKLSHWNKWRRYFGLVREHNMIEFKSISEVKEFFKEYLGFKESKK